MALALGCLGLVLWASVVAWEWSCRAEAADGLIGTRLCPSLLGDLSPLLIALGFWAVGSATGVASRSYQPVAFFLVIAAVLASGKLSDMDSDAGARLFYLLLAWLAPLTIHCYAMLLGQPPGPRERFALGGFSVLAALGSLPPIIWPFAATQQYPWFGIWRAGVRLGFVFAFLLVAIWVVHDYRQRASVAAQRRIRLVAFGTLLAFAPLFVLSLLPDTLRAPAYVPYEYTFPWLLLSPLSYAYARFRHRLVRTEAALRHALVYYLLTIAFGSVSLAAVWVRDRLGAGTPGDWLGMGLVLSAGVAVVFVPLQRLLDRLVTWVLYGHESADAELVARLAASLTRLADRETFRRLLVEDLAPALRLTRVALFLRDEPRALAPLDVVGFDQEEFERCRLPLETDLARWLAMAAEPATTDQVRRALAGRQLQPEEQALLAVTDAVLWLPLVANGTLQGLLLVGLRGEESFFTPEDRRLLALVGYQAGTAAHNLWLLETVRAREQELARAHRQSLVERERERLRLARELHDGALQQLLGVSRLLEAMESSDQRRRTDWLAVEGLSLGDLRREILKVAGQIRELSAELRPAWLRELGLAAALRVEAERRGGTGRGEVPHLELDLDERANSLPEPVAICLFRVAQEALRNALEHAGACRIEVRLRVLDDTAMLRVRDDGRGFRVPTHLSALVETGHFGLAGMAEQVESIGGDLIVRSRPARGTEVTVQAPLRGLYERVEGNGVREDPSTARR